MSKKILGVTVGTTISPSSIGRMLKPVKTINGVPPDVEGNVDVLVGSPISVTKIEGGHRITIANADTVHTIDVMDGLSLVCTDPNNDGNIVIEYGVLVDGDLVISGMTEEEVQAMIDASLGVIENGNY